MYSDNTKFLAALLPEALQKQAEEVIAQFKEKHPDSLATRQALSIFFEQEYGPAVIRPTQYKYLEDLYLVPVKSDGIPALETSLPRKCRIIPVRLNPKLLPVAAKRQAKVYALPQMGDVDRVASDKALAASLSAPEKSASSSLFSFDVTGANDDEMEKTRVCLNSSEAAAETDGELTQTQGLIDQVTVSSKADIHRMARQCLGTSIGARKAPAAAEEGDEKQLKKRMGYTDLCKRRPTVLDPLQEVLESGNRARSVAVANITEPQELNEKKARKSKNKAQRAEQLQDWYGMKKRKISEDDEREFDAINMRGILDPQKGFTRIKKVINLEGKEEGFFQYGYVIGGQGDVKVGVDIPLSMSAPRKKKTILNSLL
eukprot:Protomagalhaensia_wolfi_Nauph_80__1786@NODE_2111_length_1210_cov_6_664389_g1651_i0_p1_GENE_NODE_2111_length_1210_cov_6_664389_g1651_i0NODE_2111_length_1210_cov_6_664389_g1651_i0_p1_ORF_typecomplete_len381_score79_88Fcf2/PF08698_11/1_5e10YqzE/PF14038_6/0_19_NODE_2111_length_1210_cov_6_664389_g1651_i0671182